MPRWGSKGARRDPFKDNVHPELRVRSISIQNIVASAKFDHCIRTDQIAKKYVLNCILDISLFPGLRLSIPEPKIKILVFIGGKIVLTGGKTRDELLKAFAIAKDIIKNYLTTENLTHKTLQTAKNATKKIATHLLAEEDAEEEEGEEEEVDPLEDLDLF